MRKNKSIDSDYSKHIVNGKYIYYIKQSEYFYKQCIVFKFKIENLI